MDITIDILVKMFLWIISSVITFFGFTLYTFIADKLPFSKKISLFYYLLGVLLAFIFWLWLLFIWLMPMWDCYWNNFCQPY